VGIARAANIRQRLRAGPEHSDRGKGSNKKPARIAACCTVGKPHNITNQRSQRLSYFKPLPVPKTLTTDTGSTRGPAANTSPALGPSTLTCDAFNALSAAEAYNVIPFTTFCTTTRRRPYHHLEPPIRLPTAELVHHYSRHVQAHQLLFGYPCYGQ
jgi:hypothetical protein